MEPIIDINIQANPALYQFRIIVSIKSEKVDALFEIGTNRIKDLCTVINEYEDVGYSSEDFTESARELE